jgi:ABC-2 type transport system permease protein
VSSRILEVARREYLERVRSKAFLVGTIAGPILLAGMMLVPGLVMSRQRGKPLKVAVLDATGALREAVEAALRKETVNGRARFVVVASGGGGVEEARARLRKQVLDGTLDGYLHLPGDALERSVAEYYGRVVSNVVDIRLMDRAVEAALVSQRLTRAGLDPSRIDSLIRKLDLKTIRLSASGAREDRRTTFLFAVILLMILYTTVLMWGQAVLSGVIEEKTNRVVEVMVSSIPTFHLFGGKIAGVGAAGLTQFLVWAGSMAAVGAYGAGLSVGFTLPEISPLLLASFVAFFLLGYFLYATLYAAVGAAVNTIQEAQNLLFPVMMPLIVCMMFFPAILQSPDSTLSVTLSFIPFLTPLLMFLRIVVLAPPAWQIVLSMALTLLTIAGCTWVASRIYRVGILMYGKRPTFPELMRWVRHA